MGYQILNANVGNSNPALRLIKTLRISWQEMVSNLSIPPATPKRNEESAR